MTPSITLVDHFRGARDAAGPAQRLRDVRDRAEAFRQDMLTGPRVLWMRSFDLVRAPYPAKYALLNACAVPTPYVHICNRLFVVRYATAEGTKTLLVSPSDLEAAAETPFFKRQLEAMGPLAPLGTKLMARVVSSVEECLASCGVRPEDVDYITYDHLHTQDLRRWLGTSTQPAYFPKAKLLVMRQEWESTKALLPPQREWYCPGGIDGIPEDRVVLLDGDVMLGDGVALVRSPGHTEGNHSIVVHVAEGLMVTSENGVGPDAYAPLASEIPGLRQYAEDTGMEVVLNGNTLEAGLEQYISMIMEKTIAGPSERNPAFPNMLCSSEMTPYWLLPGMKPTFRFGPVEFGSPRGRRATGPGSAARGS